MASRFWVGGTGTWDASDTTHWAASSGGAGGQSVPGSGDTVTMDGSSGGGTVTLSYDPTITSITGGAFTGTFDATGRTINVSTFSFSGTGVRTLTITNATINISGNNATVLDISTATNLTFNKTGSTFNLTYSGSTGTRVTNIASSLDYDNLKISAGSDIYNFTGRFGVAGNLDFTGFTGQWNNTGTSYFVGGDFTLGTGMTWNTGAAVCTFNATAGTKTITTNNVSIPHPLVFNGVGGTWIIADNLTQANTAGQTITITNGTVNCTSGITISTRGIASTSGTSVFNYSGCTINCIGTGAIWNITSAGYSQNSTNSVIKVTDTSATAKSFVGNGLTYSTLWYAVGTGTADFTITGSNTFSTLKDTGTAAHKWLFTAGTTQTFPVGGWQIKGASGAVITIDSPTAATHSLTATGVGIISTDYLSIKNSVASPTTTFFAGANSTDVSGNTGWIFTVPSLSRSNFSLFM